MTTPTCATCGASIAPTPAGFVSSAHNKPGVCLAASSLAHAPRVMAVAG